MKIAVLLERDPGNDPEAIIKAAIRATPDDPDLLSHYAMYLHRLGRPGDIEDVLATASRTTRYAALLAFSRDLSERDDSDTAKAALLRAVSEGVPADPAVLVALAEHAARLGCNDIAGEVIDKALKYELTGQFCASSDHLRQMRA